MKKEKINRYKKRISINKIILILFQIIFLAMLVYSSIEIIMWCVSNKQTQKIKEDLSTYIEISNTTDSEKENNKYNIDFSSLKKCNKDVVAFLKVKGTNIEYVVVQGKDNKYYLDHSFDKSYNKAGWIFADYRNKLDGTDKNLIIYGHNRRDNSMFGTLEDVLNVDWYNNKENRNIILVTENQNYTYEVFSVYKILTNDNYIKTNFSNDEHNDFIESIKSMSIIDFGVDISSDSNILTLSTCADDSRYRIVLHARQIKN